MVRKFFKKLLSVPARAICRREFEQQCFKRFNERPVEYGFVFTQIAKLYPKKILDVGTGITALPHLLHNCGFLVTAIDNVTDYWPNGMVNRHWHVLDRDITDASMNVFEEEFDFITCVSVLEHIEKNDLAVANMFKLLRKGGHLLLTFPYSENEYVKDVYKLANSSYGKGSSYVCASYSRMNLDKWVKENNGRIIEQEFWQFWDGDFWTVGNQMIPPRKTSAQEKHQLSCLLIRKC